MSNLTRRAVLAATRAAAPASGKQAPGFYRYKLGDFEITVVNDGVWNRKLEPATVPGTPLVSVCSIAPPRTRCRFRRCISRSRRTATSSGTAADIASFRLPGRTCFEQDGLLAPAGTPKPIVAKLSAEMRRILARPEVAERLAAIEMLGSSPEELGMFIRGETDRWSPIIKKLGLKPE